MDKPSQLHLAQARALGFILPDVIKGTEKSPQGYGGVVLVSEADGAKWLIRKYKEEGSSFQVFSCGPLSRWDFYQMYAFRNSLILHRHWPPSLRGEVERGNWIKSWVRDHGGWPALYKNVIPPVHLGTISAAIAHPLCQPKEEPSMTDIPTPPNQDSSGKKPDNDLQSRLDASLEDIQEQVAQFIIDELRKRDEVDKNLSERVKIVEDLLGSWTKPEPIVAPTLKKIDFQAIAKKRMMA